MIASLVWKEYREHRAVWIAMALLAVVSLTIATQALLPQGLTSAAEENVGAVAAGAIILTGMYGLVCGAMMFAGERETRGMAFLDILPLSRAELWWGKCFTGLVFTLLYSAVVAATGLALGVVGRGAIPVIWTVVLPLVALETFAWGLCASTYCRTVLTAVALAALLPLPVLWFASGMCVSLSMHGDPGSGGQSSIVLVFMFHTLTTVGALGLSLGTFVDRDFEKRFVLKPTSSSYGTVAPKRQPRRYEVLLWLVLRQGGVLIGLACPLGFLLGLALPAAGAGLWPVATLLLGVVCGTMVFAGEQAEGAFKFWGDQRLPVGWLWLRRSALWAGVVALVCTLMLLGALLRAGTQDRLPSEPDALLHALLGLTPNAYETGTPFVFLLTWPAYGFAFGQLCTLVWRKSAVAVVVAVMTAAGSASLWVPSLLGGGLHLAQVLGTPLLMLGVCRLALWDWVTDRLRTRPAAVRLVGGVFLSYAWLAAMFALRVVEAPGGDEPFDRVALQARVTDPNEGRAGQKIREALGLMSETERQREAKPIVPFAGAAAFRPAAPPEWDRLPVVIEQGWSAATPQFADWLEATTTEPSALPSLGASTVGLLGSPHGLGPILAASVLVPGRAQPWPVRLAEAAKMPPGVFIAPSAEIRTGDEVSECHKAAQLLTARALQLQDRGADEPALANWVVVLALSRHLRHQAPAFAYLEGVETERLALIGLGHWVRGLGRRPERLLRRALEELKDHESAIPPAGEAVAAEYLRFRGGLGTSIKAGRRVTSEMESLLMQVPWEAGRARRLTDAVFAGRRRMAEAQGAVSPWDNSTFADWRSDPAGPSRERLQGLIDSSWLAGGLPATAPVQRAAQLGLCRVRAARLQVALALYQAEHGKAAPSLDALVPETLTELPDDPFTCQGFHYRVAQRDESITWRRRLPGGGEEFTRLVHAGQGILWSAGPDGSDDGGVRQWDEETREGVKSDVIFLAPRPVAK